MILLQQIIDLSVQLYITGDFAELRIQWRLSKILRTRNKSIWRNSFWYVIYYESLVNKLHIVMKHKGEKIFFGQNKVYKKLTLFFSWARTHHSFTFDSRFLYELKHKPRLFKTVCSIFHSQFRFVFIKVYIFVQQNVCTLWL